MSSMYGQLSETDVKLEQEHPALLPTEHVQQLLKPRLTGFRFAISLSFSLAFLAFVGVGYVYYSLRDEARQRQSLESSHVTLSEKTSALQTFVEQQKHQIKNLESRLSDSNQKNSSVYDEVRQDLEKNRIELQNLQKKIKVLEDRGQAIQSDAHQVQTQIVTASATPTVQPAAPVEHPVMGPVMPPTAGGERVLTVNRKFNFVVVNMGTQDAVQEGDKMGVIRDGKKIGIVQVEKLYDSFSAAAILEENSNSPIGVGDLVQKLA